MSTNPIDLTRRRPSAVKRRPDRRSGPGLRSILLLALMMGGCQGVPKEKLDPGRPEPSPVREVPPESGAQPPSGSAGPEADDEQDPLEGIEWSGRIPKAKLPEDVKNPERWRYIPEGRLVEGNVFDRFLVSSFISPIIFFESDVGLGGGVAVTDIDFRSQRRQEFAGIFLWYTTEGQQNYSIVWRRLLNHRELEGGGVIQEERSFIKGRLGYEKTLTRRFYGLGPDTEAEDETSYTEEVFGVGLGLQKSFPEPGDDFVFDAGLAYEHHNLSQGKVSGVPSTEQVFPGLVEAGDDHDGLWIEAGLRFDTRDSQHNPYRGFAVGVNTVAAPIQSRGKCGGKVVGFATGVIAVPGIFHSGGDESEENPPTDTLAASAFIADTYGSLPFWALPSLGGSNTLRGYIANRWTGESAWHASGEYRFWFLPRGIRFTERLLIERVGLALFADVGTVAEDLGDLFEAAVHTSYGFGLRFTLERTALFRGDLGFSEEGTNLAITFGLSF